MKAFVDRMWAQLREYMSKMSKSSKIRLAILSALIIVLAIVAVSLISRTNFVTLYVASDLAQAGQIQASLREMGVTPQIDGLRIMVPEERVNELRATLSAEGVMGPAGPNFDIMSQAAGFAVTESHARELYDAQDSEHIRQAILMNSRILNANVIVRRGETSPFRAAHGVRAPHAAVMLFIRGGDRISGQEAQAIADFIRGAVPGITYENIHITDSNGNSYRVGDALTIDTESDMEMRIAFENLLTEQIRLAVEQMIIPIFGINNIRVTPNVRLNWDMVQQEMVEFAPPIAGELQGMFRSAFDTWEAARRDDLAIGIPGTDSNELGTGGTPEYPFGTLEDGELYERRVSERNYEINQTTTVINRSQGNIEAVTIAVLVNADAIEGDFGIEVAELVSFGAGVPIANVSVQHIPFGYTDTTLADMYADWEAFQQQERTRALIETIIRYSVILLLAVMLLLLIRTIIRAVKPPPEPEPLLAGAGGIDYLADDIEGEDYPPVDTIEYEDVDLHTKQPGLEQIERFIDKDPGAVAQLLRNWLTDE